MKYIIDHHLMETQFSNEEKHSNGTNRSYLFSNVNNAFGKDEIAMISRQDWYHLRLSKDCFLVQVSHLFFGLKRRIYYPVYVSLMNIFHEMNHCT